MSLFKKYKILLSWVFLIMWMAVIFLFSSQNADTSGTVSVGLSEYLIKVFSKNLSNINAHNLALELDFFVRKCAHFTVYMILGFLAGNAFNLSEIKKKLLFSLILCVLYSISDEVHQYFVPGRACRIYDMVIDSTGSFIGILIYKYFLKILKLNR